MTTEDFKLTQQKLANMDNSKVGKIFELVFDKLYPNAKHSSKKEDVYQHYDRILGKYTCDIKAIKKKKRFDETFPADEFLLEYCHIGEDNNKVRRYKKGWLHAEEMTHLAIGYITKESFYFLIFDRAKLAEWCRKTYKKKDFVYREKGAWGHYIDIDGVKCRWTQDMLLWVNKDPSKIDGFVKKIQIDDLLKETVREMEL